MSRSSPLRFYMANMTFITNSQNWTIYINAASRLVCYSISLFHFCHSMYAAESSRQYVTKTPFALYYGHDFEGAILVQPADAVVAATSKLLPHNFQTRGRNNRHRLPTVGWQQVAVTKNMKRDTPSLPDQSPFIKNSRYKWRQLIRLLGFSRLLLLETVGN